MRLPDIDEFLIQCAYGYSRATTADVASTVRSFCRFLLASGRLRFDLAVAVITVVRQVGRGQVGQIHDLHPLTAFGHDVRVVRIGFDFFPQIGGAGYLDDLLRCGGIRDIDHDKPVPRAEHLRRRTGAKVAVLDVDYHHGNGTQAVFYDRADVFFCSLHADPEDEYPYYCGFAGEIGRGEGEGYTLNLPLPLETGETAYLHALDHALEAIENFAPDVLLVSLGFDTLSGDPHGGFRLEAASFRPIGRFLAGLRQPVLLVQEGGYLLAGLSLALLTAGARSLLLGLWSVEAQTTARLLVAFYERLWGQGASATDKAAALRQTMLALRDGRLLPAWPGFDPSDPFYWAPFTLVGDWR